MPNTFVCRLAPRIVKDGRPRGTLVDPAIVTAGGSANQDFREYYDKTLGAKTLPQHIVLEFGQPPQDNGVPIIEPADIILFLVGSDDVDGGSNERGIFGLGIVSNSKIAGAGVNARCTLSVDLLVQLSKVFTNNDIRRSPYFKDSGIGEIGVFGLHGAPQAHNCVRFFDKSDTTVKRHERLVGLLGMLDRFDGNFRMQIAAKDPSLAALIPSVPVAVAAKVDLDGILKDFFESASQAGLMLEGGLACRLIASLLTKRFVILTGLAGSGKTKVAQALAAWLSEEPTQYKVVAVGADWTNNENLLGYADALNIGKYCRPASGALDLILAAGADSGRPYFLVLDEMNLSHVERYFADMLSAIESGKEIGLHGTSAGLEGVPASIQLPDNLFIIGTVNVDETTYMFSPKVLDRANVIEFRATAEQIGGFLDAPEKVRMDEIEGKGAGYGQPFVAQARFSNPLLSSIPSTISGGVDRGAELKEKLVEAFGALAEIGAEFGFRTAYEISRFVYFHATLTGPGWKFEDALDAQVLQKLLPKLHGSERRLGPVLKKLWAFCDKYGLLASKEKIDRMADRLKDGFTSFAEA
jgi:hypothetical protein